MTHAVRQTLILLILSLAAILLLFSCSKSENTHLGTEEVQAALNESISHTVKTGDTNTFTRSTESLTELLLIDKWKSIEAPSESGEAIIIIIISEGYEIRIYESCVQVYDGSAGFGKAKSAYYKTPGSVVKGARGLKNNPYSDI